jgi:hypothetical protein
MAQKTFRFSAALNRAYSDLPSFTDIFDEEGFYLAFIGFTLVTIAAAFIASRFITIKEADI